MILHPYPVGAVVHHKAFEWSRSMTDDEIRNYARLDKHSGWGVVLSVNGPHPDHTHEYLVRQTGRLLPTREGARPEGEPRNTWWASFHIDEVRT